MRCSRRQAGWSGTRLVAGTAALAVSLFGCGVTTKFTTTTQENQRFVQGVHSAAPDVSHYRNDTQLILLGKAACAGFSSGVSYEQLADRLVLTEGTNPLPSEDLGAVISSAVNAYCPKYANRVQS